MTSAANQTSDARMVRPEVVEVEGEVVEQLPSALYRVRVEGRSFVTAHLSSDPTRNFIRVLPGDRVRVRLASQDVRRGAIVAKLAPT
jgi:translation initiation factor IF-1